MSSLRTDCRYCPDKDKNDDNHWMVIILRRPMWRHEFAVSRINKYLLHKPKDTHLLPYLLDVDVLRHARVCFIYFEGMYSYQCFYISHHTNTLCMQYTPLKHVPNLHNSAWDNVYKAHFMTLPDLVGWSHSSHFIAYFLTVLIRSWVLLSDVHYIYTLFWSPRYLRYT